MVVKQRNSLLVFFQGHLEYEAQTLLLEYRRDVGRYLRRERELYIECQRFISILVLRKRRPHSRS
jgi:homoserine trans-succinylase